MIRTVLNLAIVALVALVLSTFGMEVLRNRAPAMYSAFASATGTKVAYRSPEAKKTPESSEKEVEKPAAGPKAGAVKTGPRIASLRRAAPAAGAKNPAPADGSGAETPEDGMPALAVVVEDEDEGPDPRGATNEDPGLPMGVLELETTVYDGSMGPHPRPLPGGTVVAWGEEREYNKGRVYQCAVLQNRTWQKTRVWIHETDILRLDVTYEEAPRRQRDAIVDYCRAKGEYAKLEAEAAARAEARSTNPYDAEYEAALEKHEDLQRRIKENAEKVQYSQFHNDPKRGEYLKEGRKLRDEQIAEKKTFEPILQKWQAWEDGHPRAEEPEPAEETPKMRRLREKMEELAPTVHEIFPTL